MGTTVRDRIVDCAHFSRIQCVEELERETKWDRASTFGPAIIALIQKHYLIQEIVPILSSTQPMSSAPAFQASQAHSSLVTRPTKKRQFRCSTCGVLGHTSELISLLR